MSTTYFLVLGAPRSGTTLLTAMIGSHTHVAMHNEVLDTTFMKTLGKPLVGNKLCVPNQIELTAKKPAWLRLLGRSAHERLYRWNYFENRPESVLSIEDYLQPPHPVKIIGIIRNGNAVITSIMRRGQQSFETAAHRWCRGVDILHTLHERMGDDFFLLTFERLVSTPEATMRDVSPFLAVPFESGMLEGYAHTPIYSNGGIDPNRASQHKRDGIDYRLREHFPDTMVRYDELMQGRALVPA